MMSMFEVVASSTPKRPTVFLHGARNRLQHAFDDDIQTYVDRMDNATYKTVYSDDDDDGGFITREMLEQYVDITGDAYICGPAIFMEIMIRELKSIGMPESRIHYEFFGPAMDLNTN